MQFANSKIGVDVSGVPRFLRAAAIATIASGVIISGPAAALASPVPAGPATRSPSVATGTAGAAAAPAVGPSVSIGAKSSFAAWKGRVYVSFLKGGYGNALITGTVRHARAGQVIRLISQAFPFSSPGIRVQSQTLEHGGTQQFTFAVTPRIATRYAVRLFRNARAKTPITHSNTRTVFVAYGGNVGKPAKCKRPVCTQHIWVRIEVPASAMSLEKAKPWFIYVGVRLGPPRRPASAPKWLKLDSKATFTQPQQVKPNRFRTKLTFSFRVGNHSVQWLWTACTRDTEASDGIGLPGSNGCGALTKVRANRSYLG
jgi:hypothetical protein